MENIEEKLKEISDLSKKPVDKNGILDIEFAFSCMSIGHFKYRQNQLADLKDCLDTARRAIIHAKKSCLDLKNYSKSKYTPESYEKDEKSINEAVRLYNNFIDCLKEDKKTGEISGGLEKI